MSAHQTMDVASRWVRRFAGLIPPNSKVLDLACGGGRHARYAASLGHSVLAVDKDVSALSADPSQNIHCLSFDLELSDSASHVDWPLAPDQFGGIIVTNYLHRPLMPDLLSSLRAGGILIYETFAQDNGLFGKPSSPDFLLLPGELLRLASSKPEFHVLAFEDGYVSDPKPAMVQRICLIRGPVGAPESRRLDSHQ
jgi:SAM-dependent methyltransferase